MKFEDYWNKYGELHASMCNGDIKMFAREIWGVAISTKQTEIDNLKYDLTPKWKAHKNLDKCSKCDRTFHK